MEFSCLSLGNADADASIAPEPLLQVRDLSVQLPDNAISPNAAHAVCLLKEITFQVQRGEAVGILGESGAGKTTLALALLRLLPFAQAVRGSVEFEGRLLLSLDRRELRMMRGARISLIYQDSAVLNPVLRMGEHLIEVLRAHHKWSPERYREAALALLKDVELTDIDRIYESYPHQLSGGQRQRIVIAQALACRPSLVIADEPTASLDPDTASEIVGLLGRLKQRFQMAFLLISHDLVPLERLADRILVMYAGRIVEQGPRDQILQRPLHPYTRALMACAIPRLAGNGGGRQQSIPTIAGSPPDLLRPAPGCDFESRCADRMDGCGARCPKEVQTSDAHRVRCFKFGG
jgi:oligopeptide/dipeptide ABC transporter ATP-binding protein